MNMFKKRYANKKRYRLIVDFLFVIFSILFLNIGFSTYQASIDIEEIGIIVRPQKDIRVTANTVYATNNATTSNVDYNVNAITSGLHLESASSTVTFEVKITNIESAEMGIDNITEIYKIINTSTTANNLEIKSITGYDYQNKAKLCDYQIPSKCNLGAITKIYIEIGYKTNGYDGVNKDYNIEIFFDFKRSYDITYNGFSNTGNLATNILENSSKQITFNETGGVVAVATSGASQSYNAGTNTLTIQNPTSNVTISRYYSITYSGFNESTSGLPSTILYSGGTISFGSLTTVPTSVTVTNAQGDYTNPPALVVSTVAGNITITASYGGGGSGSGTYNDPYINSGTYDPSNPALGSTVYLSSLGKPKVTAQTVIVNNQSVTKVTGFEFTDTGQNGISFPNDTLTINSGVLALDGSQLSIHIVFNTNLNANQGKYILSAIQQNQNSTYSGFSLNIVDSSTSYLALSSHLNKTYSGNTLNATSTQNLNSKSDAQSNTVNTYDVVINYLPNGSQPLSAIYNNTTKKISKNSVPSNLDNAKITIGGNGLNNIDDMNSLTVTALQICKGTFDSNYNCNFS